MNQKKYVIDLDDTLIATKNLNNESYNYALTRRGYKKVFSLNRVDRAFVFSCYPNLTEQEQQKIIELKQNYFVNHLQNTALNKKICDILSKRSSQSSILWTKADKKRAIALLRYYQIENLFKTIVFSNKTDLSKDIQKITKILKCHAKDLIFYEDDLSLFKQLLRLGLEVILINIQQLSLTQKENKNERATK